MQECGPEKETFIKDALYRSPAPAWSDSRTGVSDHLEKREEDKTLRLLSAHHIPGHGLGALHKHSYLSSQESTGNGIIIYNNLTNEVTKT